MTFHLSQTILFPSRPLTERAFKVDKIARVTAFVFAATVTAAVFGVLSAWAMSQFDPAQQEIISLAHAPRMGAGNDQEVVRLEPITVVGHRAPADQPSTPVATGQ